MAANGGSRQTGQDADAGAPSALRTGRRRRRIALITIGGILGAGALWLAFDPGGPFGGQNRGEIEARLAAFESDNASLRTEATALRTRNSQLESEIAIARGAKDAIDRQAADLSAENAELKEQAAFLQQLLGDTAKQAGMSIPRLTVERQSDDVWRYSLLIVRGGSPRDEFAGRLQLQATLQRPESGGAVETVTLPDDQPDTAAMLRLAFKHYQRVEGTFRVPAGARVTSVEVHAFASDGGPPRATRALQTGLSNP